MLFMWIRTQFKIKNNKRGIQFTLWLIIVISPSNLGNDYCGGEFL